MPAPPFAKRLAWLTVCIVLGLVVGMLGHRWSGEETWYLALPGAVVLGWLYFGRPDACAPCDEASASRKPGKRDSPFTK